MKYEVKYYKSVVGLELSREKKFLGNGKAYRVLKCLANEKKDFSDRNMAVRCHMSVRSYQEYKGYLVFVGLLQIRKINASSYLIAIGEDAIELDDKMHKEKDGKRLQDLTLKYIKNIRLVETAKNSDEEPVEIPEIRDYLSVEKRHEYFDIIDNNPLPENVL